MYVCLVGFLSGTPFHWDQATIIGPISYYPTYAVRISPEERGESQRPRNYTNFKTLLIQLWLTGITFT